MPVDIGKIIGESRATVYCSAHPGGLTTRFDVIDSGSW